MRNTTHSKIVSGNRLARLVRFLKKQKKTIVFTNGCFDLIHAGHVRYLRKARRLGDVLVLGLNTDASVRKLKGPSRPLVKLAHRAEVLAALEPVDFIVPFSESTPEALIHRVGPDILVKGADYRTHEIAGARFVQERGGRVVRIPMAQGLSTSKLIARMQGAPLA